MVAFKTHVDVTGKFTWIGKIANTKAKMKWQNVDVLYLSCIYNPVINYILFIMFSDFVDKFVLVKKINTIQKQPPEVFYNERCS